jgi:outer membrane protein assembly factor BamB
MRRVRLWPLAVIVGGTAAWIAAIWIFGEDIRQHRNMRTGAAVVVGLALLGLWFLIFSGVRAKVRLAVLGGLVAALGLGAALFRVEGVSGDLIPILAPRFRARPGSASRPAVRTEAERPAPVASSAPPADAPPTPAPGKALPPAAVAVPAKAARAPEPPARGDYPQFLGPNRDGVLAGPRLSTDWASRPPRLLWRQPIGAAWSAFAVQGDKAVTQEQNGEDEEVVAYEADTGRVLWRHAEKARYETVIAGIGPRATPTIHDGRVFAMGATGILTALRLGTGELLWSRRVLDENGGQNPSWGTSGSPLVEGDVVVVSAGGPEGRSLVAYGAATGERAWSAGQDKQSYSSPALITLLGRRQLVVFNQGSVAGHDPATGELLWRHPFPADQPNVAQPLPLAGDQLLLSAGYGVGSKLLRIAAEPDGSGKASLVWETPRLKSKFANLVSHDGYVYGLDDGVLVCLDPGNGQRKWRDGRYGHGQTILVAGLLLVQAEDGEVVLVDPRPDGLRELTRFTAFDGKTWNPPALAGGRLYLRNDREAAVFELPLEN